VMGPFIFDVHAPEHLQQHTHAYLHLPRNNGLVWHLRKGCVKVQAWVCWRVPCLLMLGTVL